MSCFNLKRVLSKFREFEIIRWPLFLAIVKGRKSEFVAMMKQTNLSGAIVVYEYLYTDRSIHYGVLLFNVQILQIWRRPNNRILFFS